MNWALLRHCSGLDTRAHFVAQTPRGGTLLDLGSSDGETLNHIAELRPDLRLCSADKFGQPEKYPAQCEFHRLDFTQDRLPWPDRSFDAITCMHVIEHLESLKNLLPEVARLLKPGGRVYFETPHPKTVHLPSAAGKFTLNFYDDSTHVRIVTVEELASQLTPTTLQVTATGTSRNWIFAALHPVLSLFPESRKKFTARVHWIGWSAYLVARQPK
jgi:SAM-dependent methyltransferase